MEDLVEKMVEISEKKNSDYANEQDSFANFRTSQVLGIGAYEGAITRLGDKISRINNFAGKGEFKVSDESLMDTCIDAANYSMISIAIGRQEKSALSLIKTINIKDPDNNRRLSGYQKMAQIRGIPLWEYLAIVLGDLFVELGLMIQQNIPKHEQAELLNRIAFMALALYDSHRDYIMAIETRKNQKV